MMMKRAVSFMFLGLGLAALAGCPIYSNDQQDYASAGGSASWGCSSTSDCPSGTTCGSDHMCRASTPPSSTQSGKCAKPTDCGKGQTCGADNICRTGDCSTHGCASPYVCKVAGGTAQCTLPSSGIKSVCEADGDCTAAPGSKCLSGTCVAPKDQCADATQCAGGFQCVDGACTPSCSASKACPTGYTCDLTKGICGGGSTCSSNAQCSGGNVCVQSHCVSSCGTGGTCDEGLVCVDGGCTPDARPVLVCNGDGEQDKCQTGSICLRHSCYIACDADAGANACKSADTFNVCKPVTTLSGTYSVCGSNTNLGTQCDPTQGKSCESPLVCIDGFCR